LFLLSCILLLSYYNKLNNIASKLSPYNPYSGTSDGKFSDDWQYIFDPIRTLRSTLRNFCYRCDGKFGCVRASFRSVF
jgi:hypothetical protein